MRRKIISSPVLSISYTAGAYYLLQMGFLFAIMPILGRLRVKNLVLWHYHAIIKKYT